MTSWSARQTETCDWLRANGVDPNETLRYGELYIDTADDGTRTLHADMYTLDDNGGRFYDERENDVAQHRVVVPLVAEPPNWWKPYRKPTREQLLDAVYAVAGLHQAAPHQSQTICAHCSALDDQGTTDNAPVAWPCATVAALNDYEKTEHQNMAQQIGMPPDKEPVG
jgi:hypothetical protein